MQVPGSCGLSLPADFAVSAHQRPDGAARVKAAAGRWLMRIGRLGVGDGLRRIVWPGEPEG